jgi:hypothetical protein
MLSKSFSNQNSKPSIGRKFSNRADINFVFIKQAKAGPERPCLGYSVM